MAVKTAPLATGGFIPLLVSYQTAPADNGLLSWAWDPSDATNNFASPAGILKLVRVWTPVPITVSKVFTMLRSAGTGATPLANCFLGLYSSTGQRLGVSADQSSAWATLGSGSKSATLTPDVAGSLNLPGGPDKYVFAAHLIGTQSTTAATMGARAQQNSAVPNLGLTDSAGAYLAGVIPRSAQFGTALTAMPSSIDMTTVTPGLDYWFGVA